MVRKIIAWALDNPIGVILAAFFLACVGLYSFKNVNVEAYPDPAPAIVEVLALFPGASAEEVERQVTIPLEVTFSGMPGLKKINSKSLFGLSDLKMTWHYGSDYTYYTARQEVINRIATIAQPMPPNVNPVISPESPTGEIFRYILKVPKDKSGKEIYTLNDIKALQDWVLERELRRVPRVVDLTSFGGTVRRYEVQPDPDRMRRYGITLLQLRTDVAEHQCHGRRRLHHAGPGRHDGAEHRPLWRRARPGEQGAGNEESGGGRRRAPRGGAAANPGDPQPGHHLGQQPADPGRRRGRRGAACCRASSPANGAWSSAI